MNKKLILIIVIVLAIELSGNGILSSLYQANELKTKVEEETLFYS